MDGVTPASRAIAFAGGLALAAAGAGILCFLNANAARLPAHSPAEWLAFIAPAMFFHGLVVALGGLLVGTQIFAMRTILLTGLLMLAVGAAPWIYTPWLTGDRRGGESAGMLGTILFLIVGVPGLLLTLAGAFLRR